MPWLKRDWLNAHAHAIACSYICVLQSDEHVLFAAKNNGLGPALGALNRIKPDDCRLWRLAHTQLMRAVLNIRIQFATMTAILITVRFLWCVHRPFQCPGFNEAYKAGIMSYAWR